MKIAGALSKESGSLLWLSPQFSYEGKNADDEVCGHSFYVRLPGGEVRLLVDFEATRSTARKEFKALVRFGNGEHDVSSSDAFLEVHQKGHLLLVIDPIALEDSDSESGSESDEEPDFEEPDSEPDEEPDSESAPLMTSRSTKPASRSTPMEDDASDDDAAPNEYAARLYQRFGTSLACIEVLETERETIMGKFERLASFVGGVKLSGGSMAASAVGSRTAGSAAPAAAAASVSASASAAASAAGPAEAEAEPATAAAPEA